MMKPEDNERITRVGPGTQMGETLRRYWMPALLSEQLPDPDSDPVRVRLLGEDLVAFRNSDGKVGLVDTWCPHRRANLWFGRNEENGIRCVFHGWKFNVDGACVDMPNEPPTSNFKNKVQLKSYPTHEAAGVVWTYMGPADAMPPVPDYEWMRAPQSHRFISKTYEECNWLQAVEGGLDTSHSSFLHNNNLADRNALRTRATAPKLEVEKMPYGFRYFSIRDLGQDGNYIRAYQFIMPFQQMRGGMIDWVTGEVEKYPCIHGHMWVPIDDTTTWVYNWMYSSDPNISLPREHAIALESWLGRGPDDVIPGTFQLKRNKHNDYLIDREMQRTKNFTGIVGVNTQDIALQETMEPIVDRSKERLGTADAAIIATRQLLLEATRQVEKGERPRASVPEAYRNVRGCDWILPKKESWEKIKEMMFSLF